MSNKVDNFLDKKLEEIQNKKFEENQVKINAKKEKLIIWGLPCIKPYNITNKPIIHPKEKTVFFK